MMEITKIIKPGTKAKTISGGIEGFITAAKVCPSNVVVYEFSWFCPDGYRQIFLDEFEFETEKHDKVKIGFK